MRFIERVKNILLERNESKIQSLESKIKVLDEEYSEIDEKIEKLTQEVDKISKVKAQLERSSIDKKQIEDLKNIYEFLANLIRIEKLIEVINETYEVNRELFLAETDIPSEKTFANIERYRIIKELNKKIIEIHDASIEELIESRKEKIVEHKVKQEDTKKKKGILSRIFKRKDEEKEETSEEDLEPKKEEPIFMKYKKIISDFRYAYDLLFHDDYEVLTKQAVAKIVLHIRALLNFKRELKELNEEDEEFLKEAEPHELWFEIEKYYSNMQWAIDIITNFEKKIDEYEALYQEREELFDLDNIERILEENNQVVTDIETKRKDVSKNRNDLSALKKRTQEIKKEIINAEKQIQELLKKAEQIVKAKKLKELGYSSKSDATKKLSINTKDYIVVPIPNGIKTITEMFDNEKQVKVEINGQTFYTTYSNNVISGKINSIDSSENVNATLMIPISGLNKEQIESIKAGRIYLNKSVLQLNGVFAILPEGRMISFDNLPVKISRYSNGNIRNQVELFLGEDYTEEPENSEYYDIFKDVPDISKAEKRAKREAVKRCLFENIRREVDHTDKIAIDGKPFFLSQQDEKELQMQSNTEPLDEKKLQIIANRIEEYLIDGKNIGAKVDDFYKELLLEYMRVNKKAKAEYYEEDETTITIKGKRISIKPVLHAKDEVIAKRYSRKDEDIAYKTIKLAQLVNRFAHLAENEELKKYLFDLKKELIERVIDLSKDNPKIKVKKTFDENKMLLTVSLEIPGYNMIALHLMNKNESLSKKSNQLEESQYNIVQTSTILISGVSKELLLELKRMTLEERIKMLIDLDSNTFYKLAIRMGYNSEIITSKKDKKTFIADMVSDKKLDELIKEYDRENDLGDLDL